VQESEGIKMAAFAEFSSPHKFFQVMYGGPMIDIDLSPFFCLGDVGEE
jgi:hypothetical protein